MPTQSTHTQPVVFTPSAGFVHLHLHTEYSLLDGGNKITRLIERVKELGMNAVAVTDHGNLYGAMEFYAKAKAGGVKPILGIEAYVAPGDRTEKKPNGIADGGFHLVLLAENEIGWRNLLKLSSDAFLNGFYYKPRMDKSTLEKWSEGLIAINGHLGSSIAHHLLQFDQSKNKSHWEAAVEEAKWHARVFKPSSGGACFFVELQRHDVQEQQRINPHLIKLARELDLPLVCDNDAHFLRADDWDTHDSLCCISMGKTKDEVDRLRYSRDLYVKSPQAMAELFADLPEAIENSARIADRCNVELNFGASHAPLVRVNASKDLPELRKGDDVTQWFNRFCAKFELQPVNSDDVKSSGDDLKRGCDDAMRQLAQAGAIWRYGRDGLTPSIQKRLERELKILADKGISAYFLIVWDFVNWARQNGIPAAARGSGVGTMVGYVLGLSNSCPERYGLLFERFTDPDRSEYPDIDIDICQDGRAAVINYVRQKYGHVAQIITFGRLKAKAAIKDVARVNGLMPAEGQRLANLVPNELFITIDDALAKEPDFKAEYVNNAVSRKVIDTARALEDHARHAGVHAAGVVIATQPLDNIVPLCKASGNDDVVTQWDGPTCEKVGLLKMDFLGLRTLSTIELCRKLIRETLSEDAIWSAVEIGRPCHLSDEAGRSGAHPLDLDRLSYDDQRVLELFRRADTAGIFQFESGGMRKLLAEMQPDRLEDLIAANALFRPGPMDLIPDYCMRKHGRQTVPQVHPIVDEFTRETYGIMVYQEQVMQIVHGLGDIPLRGAYTLIKAISKKKHSTIDAERPKFVEGAQKKGLSSKQANDLFELILKFAGYGFNKCVVAETEIIDANTGQRCTVGKLFEDFQTSRQTYSVHALGRDGKLRSRCVTDVVWNGRRLVFELRTRQGRRIVATGNHPFRTLDGWSVLDELRVGDRIATARVLPVRATKRWPKHELIALAGLLSEGNTCHPTCLYFFGNDRKLVDDFASAASCFPNTKARIDQRPDKRLEVCVSTGRDRKFKAGQQPWNAAGVVLKDAVETVRSGMYWWAQHLGILGCKAPSKRVPEAVFQLRDDDIAVFVGRLWAGDGFIANRTNFTPYYATSSLQLARDVQALLLRLGVISGVHTKSFKYRGGTRTGYTVHLLGENSVAIFLEVVTPHCVGRDQDVEQLRAYHSRLQQSSRSSKDTIPAEVRRWVDQERREAGLTWRQLELQSNISMKEFVGNGSSAKRGFRRATIAALARFFESRRLMQIAHSDLFWDEIVAIQPAGTQDVYDLTVDGDHNFVANGLVVHNSHSTGYAIIAYHTAYLKTYFPNHYMAALLTYESSARKVDDWAPLLEECKRVVFSDHGEKNPHIGVEVKPPDINLSRAGFAVVYHDHERRDAVHGHVRFGLTAIKNVGSGSIDAIIAERDQNGPFTSIYDFCERVSSKSVGKAVLEALIKCGAFDSVHGAPNRAAMTAAIEDAIAAGQQAADDLRSGQMNFFAAIAETAPAAAKIVKHLPKVPAWDQKTMLAGEKEVLGFHVSGHPLDAHQAILHEFCTAKTCDIANINHDAPLILGGQLTRVRHTVVKNGKSAGEKMAMITLQDHAGSIEGVVFSSVFAKYGLHVQDDAIVLVVGRIDRSRGEPQIIVDQVMRMSDAPQYLAGRIELDLIDEPDGDSMGGVESQMQMLAGLLQQAGAAKISEGGRPAEVFVHVHTNQQVYTLRLARTRVIAEPYVLQRLRETVGVANVRIVSGGIPRRAPHGENGNGNGYHNGQKKWNRTPEPVEV